MRRARARMGAWNVSGGSLEWVRQERPEPDASETLVKVAYSGICGSDLAKLTRAPIPSPGRAWCPGHEIAGWDLGTSPPRPVVVNPLIPCTRCGRCATGDTHLCPGLRRVGWDLPGGFAEYLTTPVGQVVEVPGGEGLRNGVLADPMAVAVHGVRCGLATVPPARLGVIGSGAVAICTAAYAAHIGWDVTLLVRAPSRLGALNGRLSALIRPVPDSSNPGFDAVVDAASGHTNQPLDLAIALVRDGGHVLVQNAYDPGVRLRRDLRDVFRRSLTISGSFSFCRDDFTEALGLLAPCPSWAAPLTRALFPLRVLPTALARMSGHDRARPLKAILTTESAAQR
ncbi:alcohol dehydrogenase catalytic domain-containing protein [Nocardiopsis sp. NPDC049922]|uniref:zinc-dependent alcohol dehydrogenase n=1 Tax=Nocardiopsis sp. NPDC049922 TaxID=3155157 RepID=UPI0034058B35